MKAVQDKTHPMHDNKDVKKYVRKYKSCMCMKIKADMRNMWKLANCDFEMAASVLIAREHACKETITEGEWLSKEQLIDVFKSPEHAENYIKAAKEQGLAKPDKMRKTTIYFYMKKLERLGRRREATLQEEWRGKRAKGKGKGAAAIEPTKVLKRIRDVAEKD